MRGRNYYEARASHGVLFPPDGAVLSVSVTRGPLITRRLHRRRRSATASASGWCRSAPRRPPTRICSRTRPAPSKLYLRGRGYREARADLHRDAGPARRRHHVRRAARPALRVRRRSEVTGATSMTPAEVREFLLVKDGEPFTENALGAGVATAARRVSRPRPRAGARWNQSSPSSRRPHPGAGDGHREHRPCRSTEGPRTVVRTVAFEGRPASPRPRFAAWRSWRRAGPSRKWS